MPETVEAFVESCKQVKNLALAEQASANLSDLLKQMQASFFTEPSVALSNMLC